jgi:hypothetical protein
MMLPDHLQMNRGAATNGTPLDDDETTQTNSENREMVDAISQLNW